MEKAHRAEVREQGLAKLAELEQRRDEEEDEDDEYIAVSTARGYRRPSKAAGSQGHNSAGSVGVIIPDEADEHAHLDSSPSSPPFSPSHSLHDESDSEPLQESSDDAAQSLKKVCDI